MRIVLMPSAFAPHVGGVEVLTDRLAKSLQASGHVVEVWTARSADDDLVDDELLDGLRVRRFVFDAPRASLGRALGWPVRAAETIVRMNAALGQFQPDVLHVQCFSNNGVYATALSAFRGTPLVVTLQGETFMDDHDIYLESSFLRVGLRLGLRHARAVTGCSRFTLDDAISRFGLDAGKACVVFNGVDLEQIEHSSPAVPFSRFVLALGRVEHRKGFDLLVQAWNRIADRHRDVGLVIGGAGPELPTLRSLVARQQLDERVHFAGLLSGPEVAAMMKAADVFVVPSRVEAFGIVALEAWRAKTPLIATANGGTSEFVDDGITGVMVDPTDTVALGEAIERLLTDPALGRRLAAAASMGLARFGWSAIGKRYQLIYETVLADGRGQGPA